MAEIVPMVPCLVSLRGLRPLQQINDAICGFQTGEVYVK